MKLMRGEFPEPLCIEQGVILSCRFSEWKVRRAPGVLWMAVVSQSSVKFCKKRVFLVGTINLIKTPTTINPSESIAFCFLRICGSYENAHSIGMSG